MYVFLFFKQSSAQTVNKTDLCAYFLLKSKFLLSYLILNKSQPFPICHTENDYKNITYDS